MDSNLICPSWVSTGVCKYGLDCRFQHEENHLDNSEEVERQIAGHEFSNGTVKTEESNIDNLSGCDDKEDGVHETGRQRSESIVTKAIFSKDVRFKELPSEEERFPPPFTKHPNLYNLVKGQMGDFVEIKSGFTYSPKEKLYCSPRSGQKYKFDGSSFIREEHYESTNPAVIDESDDPFGDGDGLEEGRAPIKVSLSLSLSSSARARRHKDGSGFISVAPLGPKVHQQEALGQGEVQQEQQEQEQGGPSEFESYFQAEGAGHVKQLLPQPSLSSSIPALTPTPPASAYVDRAAIRREQGGKGLNSYERPALSHNPVVQAAAAKAQRKEDAAAEKEKKKKQAAGPEHDLTNKGNSLLRKMGWKGGGLGKKENGIASSSIVTKEHKKTSQNSNSVKGLGSKHKKRSDEGVNDHKGGKKARKELPYSHKHVLSATKSRYQALERERERE